MCSLQPEAIKQTALAHVTNELVRDWGAFGVFISEIFPEAISFYEDVDFLTGNGAGAPLGALAAANGARIEVAAEGGQSADRSEERRVGKECASTCRSRWSPYH